MAAPARNEPPLKLTQEENDALKECIQGTFWTRSIPSAIIGASMWWFGNVKLLGKPNPGKLGTIVVGTFSAVAARMASFSGCLMQLPEKVPDGTFAKIIEERNQFAGNPNLRGRMTFPDGNRKETQTQARSAYMREQPPSFLDLDTSVPEQRPLDDSGVVDDNVAPKSGPSHTYDDLRRRNREDFKQTVQGRRNVGTVSPTLPTASSGAGNVEPLPPVDSELFSGSYYDIPSSGSTYNTYMDPITPASSDPSLTTKESPASNARYQKPKRVNQYGDVIEE